MISQLGNPISGWVATDACAQAIREIKRGEFIRHESPRDTWHEAHLFWRMNYKGWIEKMVNGYIGSVYGCSIVNSTNSG